MSRRLFNLIIAAALLCHLFLLLPTSTVEAQDTITINFDDPLPSGVELRSGEIVASQGIAGSDGAGPYYAYGWPVLTTSESHDWWSGTFGIEYDATNQCWWMNDLIRMYELPASYGTEPDNYDDDSWLAWSNGLYHEGVSAGLTSTWLVSDMLKVDGQNLGDYDGYRFGCAYSTDGISWDGTTTCSFYVGQPYSYDKGYFRIMWRGDSNYGHRESQQASWNVSNWVLGDSWRACVQGYPNWVGNEVRLSIEIPASSNGESAIEWNAYADDATINAEVISYTDTGNSSQQVEQSFSAGGEWQTGSATIADDAVRVELVLPAGTVLDNVELSTTATDDPDPIQHYIIPFTSAMLDNNFNNDFYAFVEQEDIDNGIAIYDYVFQPYKPELGIEEPPPVTDANEYTIISRTNTVDTYVHSFGNGIVKYVTPLDIDDCNRTNGYDDPAVLRDIIADIVDGGFGETFLVTLQTLISDEYTYCEAIRLYRQGFHVTYTISVEYGDRKSFQFLADGASIVDIQDLNTGRIISYIVSDADSFVTAGQTVSNGCIIGRAVPLRVVAVEASGTFDNLDPANQNLNGVTIYWATEQDGTPIDIASELDIWPWVDEPCSAPDYGDCLNLNGGFYLPEDGVSWIWHFDGDSTRNPAGTSEGLALIPDGSNNAEQVLIAPDTPYSVHVVAHVDTPNTNGDDSELLVNFGDTQHVITVPLTGEQIEFTGPLQYYTDSTYGPGMYRLRVAIGDDEPGAIIVVDYICVDDQAGPVTAPPNCILLNHGFNDSSAWTLTDAPPNTPYIRSGGLELPQYTMAEQSIDLFPDNYTIEINYRALPMATPPLAGYSATLDWSLLDSDSSAVTSGQITTSDEQLTLESDEFTLSSQIQGGTFRLSANNTTDTIQIDSVCLIPETLPVQEIGSRADCNECPATYVGNMPGDIIESVSWLDCRMQNLYYCDARILIEATEHNTASTVSGIGMLGRWLSATFKSNNLWLRSAFWYIGGHLDNMTSAITSAFYYSGGAGTTIIEAGGNANLWDVFVSLIDGLRDVLTKLLDDLLRAIELLLPVATMLIEAALTVVATIERVLMAVTNQVSLLVYFVSTLMGSIDVAGVEIPGAYTCTGDLTDNSQIGLICWGFYILDNTVFSGPANLLLPLVMASAALSLFLWGFQEIKEAVVNAG